MRFNSNIGKAFIIVIVLLTACKKNEGSDICGYYKIHSANYAEEIMYLFQGINCYVGGSELDLKSDSTYKLMTCGSIMTGSWRKADSKVLLSILTNDYRIDSFSKTWPKLPIGKDLITYNIQKNALIRIEKGKVKCIEILDKKSNITP